MLFFSYINEKHIGTTKIVWFKTCLNSFSLTTLYWSAYAKPGKWAVMCICVGSVGFASVSAICRLLFWNCSDTVVFCSFLLYLKKTLFTCQMICGNYHYTQGNRNNVNKTWAPPTNNCRLKRIEHRYYAEVVKDITTQNSERKDI